MDEEIRKKFAKLENEIECLRALLNKEIARLDKRTNDCEDGIGGYIEQHRNEHFELSKMIWAAYTKTHPEYVATLLKCDEILGKSSDDGSDPQP